jgi:hypothetical protein
LFIPVHRNYLEGWRSGNALDLPSRGNGSNLGQNTSHPWAFRGFPLFLETIAKIVPSNRLQPPPFKSLSTQRDHIAVSVEAIQDVP